jgi:hypothetical protein
MSTTAPLSGAPSLARVTRPEMLPVLAVMEKALLVAAVRAGLDAVRV